MVHPRTRRRFFAIAAAAGVAWLGARLSRTQPVSAHLHHLPEKLGAAARAIEDAVIFKQVQATESPLFFSVANPRIDPNFDLELLAIKTY